MGIFDEPEDKAGGSESPPDKKQDFEKYYSSFAPKTHDCSRLLLNLTRSHWQESDILKSLFESSIRALCM